MSEERTLQVWYASIKKIMIVPPGENAIRFISNKLNLWQLDGVDPSIEFQHPMFPGWNVLEDEADLKNGYQARIVQEEVQPQLHPEPQHQTFTPPREVQINEEEDIDLEVMSTKQATFPINFTINEEFFPKGLVTRLNSGQEMVAADKTKILSAIFDQVTVFESHPTSRQYMKMADALTRKWKGVRQQLSPAAATVS